MDTTPPSLTRLTFSSPVNLSSGSQTITFTAEAADDSSGVDKVYIWFSKSLNYSLGSGITSNSTLFAIYDFSDSFADGQSSYSYIITPFNAPGTYAIDHVDVVDKLDNKHTYNSAQLTALGAQTSFTITGGTPDTTAPTLTSLSFQSVINIGDGPQPITFTAGAADDLSGVAKVYLWFTKSINYSYLGSNITSNSTLFAI